MGLNAETTWEVIRHGAAASFMLDDRGQRMVHGSFEQVNSALDIFVRDMGLVIDAARQHGYPAPLAGATEQLYLAGRRAGLGRLDDSSVIEILRGGAAVSPANPPTVGDTASSHRESPPAPRGLRPQGPPETATSRRAGRCGSSRCLPIRGRTPRRAGPGRR